MKNTHLTNKAHTLLGLLLKRAGCSPARTPAPFSPNRDWHRIPEHIMLDGWNFAGPSTEDLDELMFDDSNEGWCGGGLTH